MTSVQINGYGFETATVWTVDRVDISFTDAPGNSSTFTASVYDPNGPNAGNDTAGMTINTWTDTLIDIVFNTEDFDPYVSDVSMWDEALAYSTGFDVDPDAPTEAVIPPPTIDSVAEVSANDVRGDLQINGTYLSDRGHIVVYYNNDMDSIGFTNPPGGPNSLVLESEVLAGETVSSINIYESYPETNLLLSFSGGNLPFEMTDYPFRFSYDEGLDELTIINSLGVDFYDITAINYNGGGGSGQITNANWSVVSINEMVVNQANFVMSGGPIYSLQFFVGPTLVTIFDYTYEAYEYPNGPVDIGTPLP